MPPDHADGAAATAQPSPLMSRGLTRNTEGEDEMDRRMDRRTVAKGAGVVAGVAALGLFPASADADGAPQTTPTEPSLYDRLGGYFSQSPAVVDRFSDKIIKNPKLNKNPTLRKWDKTQAKRGCRDSSSVARCGSRQWPADPSNTRACR